MNFVQQLEECYRDLAAEARKKHPGVKEASERAQLKLRSLQNNYVAQVRKANQLNASPRSNNHHHTHTHSHNVTVATTNAASSDCSNNNNDNNNSTPMAVITTPPTTALFASSELLHPFLIAANYPNASATTQLLEISLSGMRLLIAHDAILASDAIHMVRVWLIQANVIASWFEKQYGLIPASSHSPVPAATPSAAITASTTAAAAATAACANARSDESSSSSSPLSSSSSDFFDGGPATAKSSSTKTTKEYTSGSSSSSWFGWGSSTSTASNKAAVASAALSSSQQSTVADASTLTMSSHSGGSSTGTTLAPSVVPLNHHPHPTTSSSSSSAHASARAVKNAVSSSSGGSGSTPSATIAHGNYDRWASEILSGLLQLLQFILNEELVHHNDHSSTTTSPLPPPQPVEFWTNAIALSTMWLPILPVKHTVYQAARSTVAQVVSGLFTQARLRSSLHASTWNDLLHLVARKPTSTSSVKFQGAFTLLNKTPNKLPSRALGLELLLHVFAQLHNDYHPLMTTTSATTTTLFLTHDRVVTKTLSVCMSLLHEHRKTTVDVWLRTAQWTVQLYKALQNTYPSECSELLSVLVIPITTATEMCRQSHDFEDGFVFTNVATHGNVVGSSSSSSSSLPASVVNASGVHHHSTSINVSATTTTATYASSSNQTLIPATTLWKAGLALEAVAMILNIDVSEQICLFQPTLTSSRLPTGMTVILTVTEALSDFCTILASCQLHMLQLVDFARIVSENTNGHSHGMVLDSASVSSSYYYYKPALMRKAESAIVSANMTLFDDTSTTTMHASGGSGTVVSSGGGAHNHSRSGSLKGSAFSNNNAMAKSSSLLGESLFIAMQSMLRITDCIERLQSFANQNLTTDSSVTGLLEETFAPTLAVMQHYLKRFVGSPDLVQLALRGYASLANICIPLGATVGLQRKALLTSLCKLSLPNWGSHHDIPNTSTSSSQLQDHHVRALLFLFRIVHTHHDHILEEWELILRTCEELADMSIASTLLSDEAYHAALAVSVVLCRFAAFTTCFSRDSLLRLLHSLTDIAQSTMSNCDVIGDSDTFIPQRATVVASSELSGTGKESFGGKILNLGVRAIYGGGNANGSIEAALKGIESTERTRNSFCEEYRKEFVGRLTSTQAPVRIGSIGKVPFSLVLLTDVIMANSFRWLECLDEFSLLLSRLAASSQVLRPYTMDVISMITMSNVSKEMSLPAYFVGPGRVVFADPMQSQLWAVEHVPEQHSMQVVIVDELQSQSQSQSQFLNPICFTIRKSTKSEIAESSLGALVSVLEGVGHNIEAEAWPAVIEAVASLSGDPLYELDRTTPEWSSCCFAAFLSLKLIVDDFLHQLMTSSESSDATLVSLLNCCAAFGRSRHDVNTSLTAIGLLWTIADVDSGSNLVDFALSKLVQLTCDNRQEVRHAAVNTLFSCLVGRGSKFSGDRWESCFTECIFKVYNQATYGGDAIGDGDGASNAKALNFRVSRHHSRDTANKQWVATQVLVLQGLLRVLRQHFTHLLNTTCSREDIEYPWFQDVWVNILDLAFAAASQESSRDSLEIRLVGVEVLVVSCQLSCQAGIQAAVIPARVGINMEVVHGALRSVRGSQVSKPSQDQVTSTSINVSRRNLFLEAFDGIESYKDVLLDAVKVNISDPGDDTLLQILQKFSSGLSLMFECCKGNELARHDRERDLMSFQCTLPAREECDRLDSRFVDIVCTVLFVSYTTRTKSRYLNPAQTSSMNLLKNMAVEGSVEASRKLVSLAEMSLFNATETDDATPIPKIYVSVEAKTMIADIASEESVRQNCKAFMLYDMLLLLSNYLRRNSTISSEDNEEKQSSYKAILRVIEGGLGSVVSLHYSNSNSLPIVERIWPMFLEVLSRMLTPMLVESTMTIIHPINQLVEIISAAQNHLLGCYSIELCKIVASGAKVSLDIASEHEGIARAETDDKLKSQAIALRDEHIDLFAVCFRACCLSNPKEPLLFSIASQALQNDLLESSSVGVTDCDCFPVKVAVTVCRIIANNQSMERLVISVLPILCQLVSSDSSCVELRDAACQIFALVRFADVLQTAQSRCDEAERQAQRAESRANETDRQMQELVRRVGVLMKENQQLRKDVAVLEASAVL